MEEMKKLNGLEKLDELVNEGSKIRKNTYIEEKVKQMMERPILLISPVACLSLVYYGTEFARKGQLIFTKNQFTFYIVFSLIIFGMYFCIKRQTTEIFVQNKEIAVQNTTIMEQIEKISKQNEEIKEGQIVINDLVDIVINNQLTSEDNMVQLHRSTRKIIVKAIDNKSSEE